MLLYILTLIALLPLPLGCYYSPQIARKNTENMASMSSCCPESRSYTVVFGVKNGAEAKGYILITVPGWTLCILKTCLESVHSMNLGLSTCLCNCWLEENKALRVNRSWALTSYCTTTPPNSSTVSALHVRQVCVCLRVIENVSLCRLHRYFIRKNVGNHETLQSLQLPLISVRACVCLCLCVCVREWSHVSVMCIFGFRWNVSYHVDFSLKGQWDFLL